ncbi:DUF885 domain-containing protein [Sphingomonas oleivorans]|nr:DUF885 domain-containing protein [Sphingomonas oleivorans]
MAMLAAGAALPSTAAPGRSPPVCPVMAPLDAVADRLFAHLPEIATYNGLPDALDGGPLARRMDDHSPEGETAWRAALKAAERDVAALTCPGDRAGTLRLAIARTVLANGTRSTAIPYGRPNPFSFSGHAPYAVTQISGPHIDTPSLMQNQQALSSPPEVDAWIERLDGFQQGFAGLIEKLKTDMAAGCRPPRILLEKTLPIIDAFLAGPAADHPLIAALRRRTATAALDPRLRAAAEQRAIVALEKRARPAYSALRAWIMETIPRGREDAGLWVQPDGDALYAANIRALGDTALSPEQIHAIGLEEVRRISAALDALLRLQGMGKGSVGARLVALAADPRQRFPDSEAGRAALLDHVRGLIAAMEKRQPSFLPAVLIPSEPLEVRRVPVATQDGAPGGYYDAPSLDGSRPGIYWINLRDMAGVPRFRLPTLSYHEGVPGHHTQATIALALPRPPLINAFASFNAYSEGWALYAERLAADLGAYRADRHGDIGRLQDELFRAVRLVVDTGLHHHRWSRERAIAYMRQQTGAAESRVTAEVERYMAWPGQALGYKLGQLRMLELRRQARAALGRRFDLRSFHAALLGNGAMPMDLVAAEVARLLPKRRRR